LIHALHTYVAQSLRDKLEERRVVVFYDSREEFDFFVDGEVSGGVIHEGGVATVQIAGLDVQLARFKGSYFELLALVEPLVSGPSPEPLLIYIPGEEHARRSSVLMEMELAGICYEPQLRRLARRVLLQCGCTDAQADELLDHEGLTYEDISTFILQVGPESSLLASLFGNASSDETILKWLASDERDAVILHKGAVEELFRLVENRLGLALAPDSSLAAARDKTARYALVTEFLADLSCDAPTSCAAVPYPPSSEHQVRIRTLLDRLRSDHGHAYEALADVIQRDLGLSHASLDPACLGSIDTFRFEEARLLHHTGRMIQERRFDNAAGIIEARRHSFWSDRDIERQAQWEACWLMSQLGLAIERIRPQVASADGSPSERVDDYTAESGWHEADTLHRRLQTWLARMEVDPENETAVAVVERLYDLLLHEMAEGFTAALQKANWSVVGVAAQTAVFGKIVRSSRERAAFILVDALRYEMADDLVTQLDAAREVDVEAAIASLPSITEVGMAAVLPGAAASFSVVEHQGRLAARIGGDVMCNVTDRMKHLKAEVPGAVEMSLDAVLSRPKASLKKAIDGAPLIVVRSPELDSLGESASESIARQVIDAALGNVARAVRRLAAVGVARFVVTADHGHLYSVRKQDDMKIDSPSGDTVTLHRRCWAGRGGSTPNGCVRVSGPQLGYDTDLDFVFPAGLGVFKAGDDLSYHHGGLSLQETVVPVISFRMLSPEPEPEAGESGAFTVLPDKITNRLFPVEFVVQSLLAVEPVPVRIVLMHQEQQIGKAGMATNAECESATGIVQAPPNTKTNVVMMLDDDLVESLRVMIQDPRTEAVLAQSDEIPVSLGV